MTLFTIQSAGPLAWEVEVTTAKVEYRTDIYKVKAETRSEAEALARAIARRAEPGCSIIKSGVEKA